jgi:hypothetical protein
MATRKKTMTMMMILWKNIPSKRVVIASDRKQSSNELFGTVNLCQDNKSTQKKRAESRCGAQEACLQVKSTPRGGGTWAGTKPDAFAA